MAEDTNVLNEEDFLDFDLDELEELEGFIVPSPGVYVFEGVSLGQERRTVRKSKEDSAEIDVVCAVASFKVTEVTELAQAGAKQDDITGKELRIVMQLEEVTDGFFFKKQQGQMAFLTKPLKDAIGVKHFKELSPAFPGMVFSGVIANRKRKDKDTGEVRVSWEFAKPVVAA